MKRPMIMIKLSCSTANKVFSLPEEGMEENKIQARLLVTKMGKEILLPGSIHLRRECLLSYDFINTFGYINASIDL